MIDLMTFLKKLGVRKTTNKYAFKKCEYCGGENLTYINWILHMLREHSDMS